MVVQKSFAQILLPNDPGAALQSATKQYADNNFATTVHTHTESQVTSLTTDLAGKEPALVPTASKTAAYTAAPSDLVLCNGAGGAFTVTLPAAAAGSFIGVKKTDATSANVITISRAGSDTIGAAAATTITLTLQDETVVLMANGSNWVRKENQLTLATLDTRYQASGSYAPTASPTFTGTATFAKMVQTPVALTYVASGTTLVDASLGNTFRVTLTNTTTAMGAPSNPTDGQLILFEIKQDGTGSRLATWVATAGGYVFGTDVVSPTLSTAINKTDLVGFIYNSTANIWRCLAWARGY
jgi:hypothetical protein